MSAARTGCWGCCSCCSYALLLLLVVVEAIVLKTCPTHPCPVPCSPGQGGHFLDLLARPHHRHGAGSNRGGGSQVDGGLSLSDARPGCMSLAAPGIINDSRAFRSSCRVHRSEASTSRALPATSPHFHGLDLCRGGGVTLALSFTLIAVRPRNHPVCMLVGGWTSHVWLWHV